MAYGHGSRFSKNSKSAKANGGNVKVAKHQPHKHHTKPLCNSCGLSSETMIPLCQMCYYNNNGDSEERIRFEHLLGVAEKKENRKKKQKGFSKSKLKKHDLTDRTVWLEDNVILIDDKYRVTSNTDEYIPEMYVEVIHTDKVSKKYYMRDFKQVVSTFVEGKRKAPKVKKKKKRRRRFKP